MKKLPKRDGYKLKRPQRQSDRFILHQAIARELAAMGKDHGVEIPPLIAKLAESKARVDISVRFGG